MRLSKQLVPAILLLGLLTPALADQEDLEEMIDAAFEAVRMTKHEQEGDDELTDSEDRAVERNTRSQIRRHADEYGDFDDQGEHFVESVWDMDDSEEYFEHVQTCKVCNPFVNRLLRGTDIERVDLVKPTSCQVATHCFTPYGACGMAVATLRGSQCYCPTMWGPVWGSTGCFG